MLDTVRFEIHGISSRSIKKIEKYLNTRMYINNATGAIYRELTTGTLSGSYDSRISLMISEHVYSVLRSQQTVFHVYDKKIKNKTTSPPIQRQVKPFVILEFSLPKWKDGINFIGSTPSQAFHDLLEFKVWLSKELNIPLPPFYNWLVKRIDTTILFDLGNDTNCKSYLKLFRHVDFPRREKPSLYPTSFHSKGSINVFKLYMKSYEFKKHDYIRIKKLFDKTTADRLHDLTKGLLKFEISWKNRKLNELQIYNANQILKINWYEMMKKEMLKLIHGSRTGKTYRLQEISDIIMNCDNPKQQISKEGAIAVWTIMCTQGKVEANKLFGKMKVSRACQLFKDLEISTLGLLQDKTPNLHVLETNIFEYKEQDTTKTRTEFKKVMGL